jgi:hypothetical protein
MNLLIATMLATSHACPTIATGSPSQLSFDVAKVAIVRQGRSTTFSVSINPMGEPQNFALLLPVPDVMGPGDVTTLDSDIFARLDGYSAPRHVADAGCPVNSGGGDGGGGGSYGGGGDDCDDGGDGGGGGDGGDGGDGGEDPYATVEIEAEYLVGAYEVVVLSAVESADLYGWLSANGYYLPDGAEPRLAEYIERGSYFLAAKVSEDAAATDGVSLAPLQVSYESDIFAIPMRLATLNSPGEQDMVIYAITNVDVGSTTGRVGIANYPEIEVQKTCRWGSTQDSFGEFYEDQFTGAWSAVDDAGWVVEYAGRWNDCSPCSTVSITAEDLDALGFESDQGEAHFLTRIRMRYTPDQAQQDLVLYGSAITEHHAQTYADDHTMHRGCILTVCDAAPDSVDEVASGKSQHCGDEDEDGGTDHSKSGFNPLSGCAVVDGRTGGVLLVLFGALLGMGRRRRPTWPRDIKGPSPTL